MAVVIVVGEASRVNLPRLVWDGFYFPPLLYLLVIGRRICEYCSVL